MTPVNFFLSAHRAEVSHHRLFRRQNQIKRGAFCSALRVMLADQSGKPAHINQKVNMRRAAFVRSRKIGFQAVAPPAIRDDRSAVRIIVDSRWICLPEFDAGAGQRTAIYGRSNRPGKDIPAADLGTQGRTRPVKRPYLIPRRGLTFRRGRNRCGGTEQEAYGTDNKTDHGKSVPAFRARATGKMRPCPIAKCCQPSFRSWSTMKGKGHASADVPHGRDKPEGEEEGS